VAQDEWTFTADWPADGAAALGDAAAVVLRLGGVDTVARVVLNGQDVGAVDNAHRWGRAGLDTAGARSRVARRRRAAAGKGAVAASSFAGTPLPPLAPSCPSAPAAGTGPSR
jgi:hypothetical protein